MLASIEATYNSEFIILFIDDAILLSSFFGSFLVSIIVHRTALLRDKSMNIEKSAALRKQTGYLVTRSSSLRQPTTSAKESSQNKNILLDLSESLDSPDPTCPATPPVDASQAKR